MAGQERSFSEDALVLKSLKRGESDRVIVFFSKDRGKGRALIRAVRRSANRYQGHVDTGTLVRLNLYRSGQAGSLDRVTGLEHTVPFLRFRSDLERAMILNYVCNIVEEAFPWDDPHPEFFCFLKEFLLRFEEEKDRSRGIMMLRYCEGRILQNLGIRPEWQGCACCKTDEEGERFFDLARHAVFCSLCVPFQGRDAVCAGPELIRFLSIPSSSGELPAEHAFQYKSEVDLQGRCFFRSVFMKYLDRRIPVLEVAEAMR